jgi:hypothetical protein
MNDDRIRDTDRLIDELGTGGTPPPGTVDDPLWTLLARAREEIDRDIPAAPDVTRVPDTGTEADTEADVVPLDAGRGSRRRRRLMRHTRRAATAGGLSITGMLVTGGVAAAIAVGGFSVAAYNGVIPGIAGRGDVSEQQAEDGTTPSATSPVDTSRAPSGAPVPEATAVTEPPAAPAAPADEGDGQAPVTEPPSDLPTDTTPDQVPGDGGDGGMVIAGGEDGAGGPEGPGMTALSAPDGSGASATSSTSESAAPSDPETSGGGKGRDPGGAVTLKEPKEPR